MHKALTFIKFIASSLTASLIDLAVFKLLCVFFASRGTLSTADLYIAAATVLARAVSAVCNYMMNYRVVFRSDVPQRRSFSRYILLAAFQVSMSAFLVTLLHGLVGGEELFCKLPVDCTLFLFSYFVQREKVYK